MYKLINTQSGESVIRSNDDGSYTSIPFDESNTDYQAFKKAVNEGAELEDADGDLMTAEQAKEYVATLP